jgi:hypothetical protein
LRPNGAEDLRVALTARPELAEDRIATTLDQLATERDAGRRLEPESAAARLVTAMEREKVQRQDPAVRAECYVARWTALEKAYEYGDWKDRTRAKAEMKALTSELKRDAPAEAVMKSRGRELGIEWGSRVERVLDAKSEREAMQLERGLSTRTEVPCLTALGAGCEQPEEALAHVERYSFNHIMNVFAPCDPCFALDADFTVGLAPMPNKKRLYSFRSYAHGRTPSHSLCPDTYASYA